MRPPLVVPGHPVPNDPARLLKRLELILPDTLFFETPKEPFDAAVLLRRVGRDELLLQPTVPTGLPEAPTLKGQAVITAQHWGACLRERPAVRHRFYHQRAPVRVRRRLLSA